MQEPWPFAPVPQIGSLPSGRDPLSKRTLNRLRFVRGANMTHRPPPYRKLSQALSLETSNSSLPWIVKDHHRSRGDRTRFPPAVRRYDVRIRRGCHHSISPVRRPRRRTGHCRYITESGIRVSLRTASGRVLVGFPALEVRGLEPLTYGLQSHRSSQLSYTPGEPKHSIVPASKYSLRKRGPGKGRAPKG